MEILVPRSRLHRPNDTLKPGTLVVSHNYGMGDWEPAEVIEMEAEGTTHYVYSWVVPAR